MGVTLLSAVETYPPLATLQYDSAGNITAAVGMFQDIFYVLKKTLNFTIEIIRPPDGAWGNKMKNGSWTGMIRMLMEGEADVLSVGK
jgi:hypothetical protein